MGLTLTLSLSSAPVSAQSEGGPPKPDALGSRPSATRPPEPGPRVLDARAAPRVPKLGARRTGGGLRLVLEHPRFYDLDSRRLRERPQGWDVLKPEPSGAGKPSFPALLRKYADYLETPERIALCPDRSAGSCAPCEDCSIRVTGFEALGGGAPPTVDGRHLADALLRLEPTGVKALRGPLCEIAGAVPFEESRASGESRVSRWFEVFSPPVRVEFEVTGGNILDSELGLVRVSLPGWSQPFVSSAYGLEIYEPSSSGTSQLACRSIESTTEAGFYLPTEVAAPIQPERGRLPPLAARTKQVSPHLSDGPKPFRADRDRTEVELLGWTERSLTLQVTEPKIMNLDASSLGVGAPGHGWDLWDPVGWSRARCQRFRSVQCLVLAWADALAEEGRLRVVAADGQSLTCDMGCSVRLLEVQPAADLGEEFAPDDVLSGMILVAGAPDRPMCRPCVTATHVDAGGAAAPTDSTLQFASPNVRVVLEVHLSQRLLAPPRLLTLSAPGMDGPGSWFAGVDVGVPVLDTTGRRFGRARRFCRDSVVQAVVTTRLAGDVPSAFR